jgi:hypothetical protein
VEKQYVENHVRFLDEDGQSIAVLCTKGDDILPFLRDRLGSYYGVESKPKNLGYVVANVAASFLGHLVRSDVSDDTVEVVYVVADVEDGPWITAFDNRTGEFTYEGPV